MSTQWRHWISAPRFTPLVGALIGAAGGAVYWLGAQIWPTSIAVILSMLATTLLSARTGGPAGVFTVLVKYNALMALSAANLPFAMPANLALGLIMIAGYASSRALGVSVLASPTATDSKPVSQGDLAVALAVGFAPAALIGIPGLIGLVGALLTRIAFIAHIRRGRPLVTATELDRTQQLTEVCFYLSALAARAYI